MSDATAPDSMDPVRDFPDRLPAMVVKELRQGLRARLFAETVVGFHLLLMVAVLPVASFASPTESVGIQKLVWWVFAAVLVLLLPLRGLGALLQERRENTLDTLLLTNLRAGRIVWGKWSAIAAQILVVGISVIPYLLILYAGGGVSLPGSLMTLLRLMLGGLVMTAVFIALSWNESWLHRAGPGLALGWLAMSYFAWPLVGELLGSGSGWWGSDQPFFLAELPAAAALLIVLLEGTAQRLAPGLEAQQAVSRLVALGLLALTAVFSSTFLQGAAWLVLTLVSVQSLTESWPVEVRGKAAWHRWPGLAPGWPHGVLWALGAWALAMALEPSPLQRTLPLAAWLFCGRLLIFLNSPGQRHRSWLLLVVGMLFLVIQTALVIGAGLLNIPALLEWSRAIPAPPIAVSPGAPPHVVLKGLAAGAALLCGVLAILALRRVALARKGGIP